MTPGGPAPAQDDERLGRRLHGEREPRGGSGRVAARLSLSLRLSLPEHLRRVHGAHEALRQADLAVQGEVAQRLALQQ